LDQRQQPVVLGPAGDACGEVMGDAGKAGAGVKPVGLRLDVAIEDRARRPAAGVAVVGLEERFEEAIAL
jgi:hypothetical protein